MSREQQQFLDVIDRDEAERRFHRHLTLDPLPAEAAPLERALQRVLAEDVLSPVDVPAFDRSNLDGYAVRAADTYGADEQHPRRLRLLAETIATAVVPQAEIGSGEAMSIATGGMLPRGADAILMIEHADLALGTTGSESAPQVLVNRSVTPGAGVSFAGTDITAQETVLRAGQLLTSRETGVLAAIGVGAVPVVRRPRVGILSTGDEIIPPGEPMRPGCVYDSNARILADAVIEQGGEPLPLGILPDDLLQLSAAVANGLRQCDVVLLSGGTSKGEGDLCYRVVQQLTNPGIVAHGVALKPGKPICLAVSDGKPVVILPGFPTSAIFTFHEFVAPVIRRLAGRRDESRATVTAELPVRVNSVIGRTEYLLVGLVPQGANASGPLAAYPMGKGSGSVTTFSCADGFVTIDRHQEILEAGQQVKVQLLGQGLQLADLVVIGSHCIGLDWLLSRLQQQGYRVKFLAVGSTAGLQAAQRGECDIAGIHLLDPATGQYNRPFVAPPLTLVSGYPRRQGVIFRRGDARFEGLSATDAVRQAASAADCLMVNRNQGSGTRILIDQLLEGAQPPGYAVQSRSHNAVAAAIQQGRADWGLAIESVAQTEQLGFLPYRDEQYDFVIAAGRQQRPAVSAFCQLLEHSRSKQLLPVQRKRSNNQPL